MSEIAQSRFGNLFFRGREGRTEPAGLPVPRQHPTPSTNPETPRPTVSVALCTHNGEGHLEAFLQSMLAQTEQPDELVIGDDGSTDRTTAILSRFRHLAPFPVRITHNPERLGITPNFEATVRRCRCEITVLADQDDLFYRDKLQTIRDTFAAEPETTVSFSDADLIDAHGKPLGMTLWQRLGFQEKHQRAFSHDPLTTLLRRDPGYGMTMAVRTEAAHSVFPIAACWPHDSWLAFALATLGKAALIPIPLCGYRQHAGQAVPFRLIPDPRPFFVRLRAPEYNRYEVQIGRYRSGLARLRTLGLGTPAQHQTVEALIKHYRVRGRLRMNKPARIPKLLVELLSRRYHRFSNGFAGFAKDLVLR